MKASRKTLLADLLHLKLNHRRNDFSQKSAGDEPPLRSELFSADQMRQHGRALAGSHELSSSAAAEHLLTRVKENEGVLIAVRSLLTEAVVAKHGITHAGEWLLDNFYLIEEQISIAKKHLPEDYSRELPRLRNGPSANLPDNAGRGRRPGGRPPLRA